MDKKLKLLKKRVGNVANSTVKIKRNSDSINNVLNKNIKPLLNYLEEKLLEFDSFFKSRMNKVVSSRVAANNNNFVQGFEELYSHPEFLGHLKRNRLVKVNFESQFVGLINSGKNISLKGVNFDISFYENVYEISGAGIKKPIHKLYDQLLEEDEIHEIVHQLCDWQYNVLEELINKTAN